MMTVTFAPKMHPEITTWGGMVSISDGGFALRPDLQLLVVDDRHRCKVLWDWGALPSHNGLPENALKWLSELLRISAARRDDEAVLTPFETMTLSRRYNMSTAMVQKTLSSSISYTPCPPTPADWRMTTASHLLMLRPQVCQSICSFQNL